MGSGTGSRVVVAFAGLSSGSEVWEIISIIGIGVAIVMLISTVVSYVKLDILRVIKDLSMKAGKIDESGASVQEKGSFNFFKGKAQRNMQGNAPAYVDAGRADAYNRGYQKGVYPGADNRNHDGYIGKQAPSPTGAGYAGNPYSVPAGYNNSYPNYGANISGVSGNMSSGNMMNETAPQMSNVYSAGISGMNSRGRFNNTGNQSAISSETMYGSNSVQAGNAGFSQPYGAGTYASGYNSPGGDYGYYSGNANNPSGLSGGQEQRFGGQNHQMANQPYGNINSGMNNANMSGRMNMTYDDGDDRTQVLAQNNDYPYTSGNNANYGNNTGYGNANYIGNQVNSGGAGFSISEDIVVTDHDRKPR